MGHAKHSSKKTKRDIAVCALLLWFLASPVAAQSGLDLISGPSDVLYNQSGLWELLRQSSFSPKMDIDLPKVTPDIPRKPPLDSAIESRAAADLLRNEKIQPVIEPGWNTRVRWMPALMESFYYTGIMHSFDITTEAGTRDTLNGHWFQHYMQSVGSLRGWSDGDTFMAPYAGHPIEGSVFGYIFRQNDPKYRDVQWGDGRDYFISLLRSMAYSAAWHAQWKIGPISEASIGNVMLHASPGFITLVDTPTLGAVTMMVEDVADRYAIMGLENHTDNGVILILARCFLSPGRSFANLMAFRVPWNRDTRPGLFGQNHMIRKQLLDEYKLGQGRKPFIYERRSPWADGMEFRHTYPKEAPIELAAFSVYESFLGGGSCVGGGGSGAARISAALQAVAEVNGCLVMRLPEYNQSADSLFYGGGLRWTPRAARRFSPYAEFLFGGRKITQETDDAALRAKLMTEWNDGNGTLAHYPKRSDWSVEVAHNGPSIAVGGGVDAVMTRAFAWRLISMEYTRTWMGNVEMVHPQNGVRVTTQAVLRIGTW